MRELDDFIAQWEDSNGMKGVFVRLRDYVAGLDGAQLSFHPRPGVTYSLRAAHPNSDKSLFVMVDVVDDDPADRWLSVCFFGEMITDPDELGDLIPEGLLGEDGYCFDVDEAEGGLPAYLEARIAEAHASAAG